jgi:putative FmdB family regulatory protein
MPVYEYECMACGETIEAMQKFSDAPLSVCRECGGQLKKLISNTSFVLKGTGWYVTDYARKGSEPSKDSAGKEANTPAGATATESKPDSSKETKPEGKKEPSSAS